MRKVNYFRIEGAKTASQNTFDSSLGRFEHYHTGALVVQARNMLAAAYNAAAHNIPSIPAYQFSGVELQQIDRYVKRLERYIASGLDSAGENADPPSPEALRLAILNCVSLVAHNIPAPEPKILADGTLGGFWSRGNCYATVEFDESGENIWAVTNGEDVASGTWKSVDRLPQVLGEVATPAISRSPIFESTSDFCPQAY